MHRLFHIYANAQTVVTWRGAILNLYNYSMAAFEPRGWGDLMLTFQSLEVTAPTNGKNKKKSFVTAGEQTLKGTAASFVLTMQTAVGFVRSLYDNENHYRITWGFRTWEQRGGEGRATLGLINGLWRCPSGPLYGFFFLLFYPLSSLTTPLSFPSSVLQRASVKASRPVVKD